MAPSMAASFHGAPALIHGAPALIHGAPALIHGGVIPWRRHFIAPTMVRHIKMFLWSVNVILRSTNYFVTRRYSITMKN